MPNTRRRRFSVQNEIATRNPSKMANNSPNRHQEFIPDINQNSLIIKSSKSKNKSSPINSKTSNTLEIVADSESSMSVLTTTATKKQNTEEYTETMDKDVTARSSNIDLFNILSATDNMSKVPSKETVSSKEIQIKTDAQQANKDKTPIRRDKHPRQHRVKVRSPKRRVAILDPDNNKTTEETKPCKKSIGTIAIDWNEEISPAISEVPNIDSVTETMTDTEPTEETRTSDHSLDDMCRICHGGEALSTELGQLISACSCRGTVGRVHVKCLERWLTESGKTRCELCGTRYTTRRVHRYGMPRALIMWVLSQNAKQLMVDSLGIMLMSPLAVLAAWLSGRTLAGLMMQESHVTPWPLASTFVLACMTLVCYYCWIVSAATRHALGWWIWYRSQYEVRLQLQGSGE